MSVTAKVGIDVQMDSTGGESIVAQLKQMETELVSLAATSEGIQKGWAESMLRAVRTSRDMLTNFKALSGINLTAIIDDATVTQLEGVIETAVRNGVSNGFQAAIAAAPQLAQVARQQVARVRVAPTSAAGSDASAVASLTKSIVDLESTMRTYAITVGQQSVRSGAQIKQRSETLTGRPQFNVMQELNEVALRVQGRELNSQSEGLVKLIGNLGADLARSRADLTQFGVQLRDRLDFSRLDREFVLPDELEQGGFAHVARTAFGALEGRFNLQLFSSMDLFLEELERQFDQARAQGARGMSSLQDAQGRWLTESIEGQRFLASLAQQLSINARGASGTVPQSVVDMRTQLANSPSAVNLDAMSEQLGNSDEEQEYKSILGILGQMFQRFEGIKDAKEIIADLNNRENGQLSQQLQTLERMRAVNRDEVGLAKELNAVSTRYNSVISQNRSLLVGASDSLNAAISTGNFKELLSLQRQYETQAQKNLNLVKELQVVIERASNLESGYMGQIRERSAQTVQRFSEIMPRLREFIALTQAADNRSQRGGGSATFAPFIEQIREAAQDPALAGIIGPDMIEKLFSTNNSTQFLPNAMISKFQQELVTKLTDAIQNPETSTQVVSALAGLMNKIGGLAGAGAAREDLLSGAGQQVAQMIGAIAPQAEEASSSLEELFFNLMRVSEARKEAGVRQSDVKEISTQTSAVLSDIRSKTRVTEEPARITEKTLRDAERYRVAFLEIQDTLAEVDSWRGVILDPSQVEIAKSLETRLANMVRQGDQLVKRLEIARRREISGIDTEEANARAGQSSIFSEAARGAQDEAERLKLIAEAANAARIAKNKYYDDTIKGVTVTRSVELPNPFGGVYSRTQTVKEVDGVNDLLATLKDRNNDLARSSREASIKIAEGFNNIGNEVQIARQQIGQLDLTFQRVASIEVRPDNLEIVAQISKNAAAEAQQLFQKLSKVRAEAQEALNFARATKGSSEEVKQLTRDLRDADTQLALFMNRAEKMSAIRFTPEFQQQQFQAGLADRGRSSALNTQTFDPMAMRQQMAEINQDLQSMDVTRLAMASNEFKALRAELQGTYNAAIKGVRSFDALEASIGSLTPEQVNYRNELRRTVIETERLIATSNHMAGSVKTADLVVNATTTTFRDYAFQLVEGIKQQLDFAIGAGAMTAVLGSVGIAFREVISEARNMTRAFTVLQSDTKSFEEITVAATEAVRSAAVRFGLPLAAAADVVKELGSAGLSTEETLSALIPTLKTINSTNSETTQITRAVAGIYNVFKKNMADAGAQGMEFETINNTLVAVFRNHQAEMDEMVQGYKFVIGTGRAAGFTFQDMGAYLAVLNDNMIKSGMAGRGLQTIFAQLSSKGEMLKKMFGVEINPNLPLAEQFMDILEQMNKKLASGAISAAELDKVFQIFDREGARGFVTLAQKFPEVQKALRRIKDESAGVNDELSSLVTKSLDRKFNQMRQAILDLIRQGFDKLAPYAISFLEFVKGSAMALSDLNRALGGALGYIAVAVLSVLSLANTFRVLAAVMYGVGALQSRIFIGQIKGMISGYLMLVSRIYGTATAYTVQAAATAQATAAQAALNGQMGVGAGVMQALGLKSAMAAVGFKATASAILANAVAISNFIAPLAALAGAFYVFTALSTGAAEGAAYVENLQNKIDDLNASISKTSAKQNALKEVGEAFNEFDKLANLGAVNPENLGAAVREQITKIGDEALTMTGITLMSNKEIGESYRELSRSVRQYAKEREQVLALELQQQRQSMASSIGQEIDLSFGGGKSLDAAIDEVLTNGDYAERFAAGLMRPENLTGTDFEAWINSGISKIAKTAVGLPTNIKERIEKDFNTILSPGSLSGMFKDLDAEMKVQTDKLAELQKKPVFKTRNEKGTLTAQIVNEREVAAAIEAINKLADKRAELEAKVKGGDFSVIEDEQLRKDLTVSTKRIEDFFTTMIKTRSRLRTAYAVKPTDLAGNEKITEMVLSMSRLQGPALDALRKRMDEYKVSVADIESVGEQDAFAQTFKSLDSLRDFFGVPLDTQMFDSVVSNLTAINGRVDASKKSFAEFRKLTQKNVNDRANGFMNQNDFSGRGFGKQQLPSNLRVDKKGVQDLFRSAVMIDKSLQEEFVKSLGGKEMEDALESLFMGYDEKTGMATLNTELFMVALDTMNLKMMDAGQGSGGLIEALGKITDSMEALTQNKILEATAEQFKRLFMDIEQGAIRAVESNSLMSKIYKRNEFAQQFVTTRENVREAIAAVEELNAAQTGQNMSGAIGKTDKERLAMAQAVLKAEKDRLTLRNRELEGQSLTDEGTAEKEANSKALEKQSAQSEFINQLAKVLFESQANRIRQNREIAAQIEKEKNAFNDAAFAAKQINIFQTDGLAVLTSTAARARLVVDQKMREMKLDRELLGNGKESVAAYTQLINQMQTFLKERTKLLDTYAEENEMLMETYGIAASLTAPKGFREVTLDILTLASKLPAINRIRQQINEVNSAYAKGQTTTAQMQSETIRLLNKEVKLLKERLDILDKIKVKMEEAMFDDKRPDIAKDFIKAIQTVRQPLEEFIKGAMSADVSRSPLETSLMLSKALGVSFNQVIGQTDDFAGMFLDALKAGKVNMDALPDAIGRAAVQAKALYDLEAQREKVLLDLTRQRMTLNADRFQEAVQAGDYEKANKALDDFDKDFVDMASRTNAAGLIALDSLRNQMQEQVRGLEKAAKNELLISVGFSNMDAFKNQAALIRDELKSIMSILGPMMGSGNLDLAAALRGEGSYRLPEIEKEFEVNLGVLQAQIDRLKEITDAFARVQNAKSKGEKKAAQAELREKTKTNTGSYNGDPSVLAAEAFGGPVVQILSNFLGFIPKATELYKEQAVTVGQSLQQLDNMRAGALAEDQAKIMGGAAAARMLTRTLAVGVQDTMAKSASDAVAQAATGAQTNQAGRELEVKGLNAVYKNTALSIRKSFLEGVDKMIAGAGSSWTGLAASLMMKIPAMFETLTTMLNPALESIGNIDYAIANAAAFEQLIVDIQTASEEFASSVQTANDGLARNESSYYDYVNTMQDAERTRYEALIEAEKTYQEALQRTGETFKTQFLGPVTESITGGLGGALTALGELPIFTADDGALNTSANLKTLFAGFSGAATGTQMLEAGAGIAGAGVLSLASGTISAIGSVMGVVFNAAIDGQSEYLIDFIRNFAQELPNTIKTVLKEVGPLFKQIFLILVDEVLPNVINALISVLPSLLSDVLVTVVSKIPDIVTMMLGALFQLIRPLIGVVFEMVNSLLPNLGALIAELMAMLPTLAVLMIVGLVENLPMLLAGLIPAVIGAVIGIVPDLILRIVGGISKGLIGTDITGGFSLTKTITKGLGSLIGLDKFHEGGMVPGSGERPAMLLGGEAVLTREAVQMLGGATAINNINGGQFLPDYQRAISSSSAMAPAARTTPQAQNLTTNNQSTQTFNITLNVGGVDAFKLLNDPRKLVKELRKQMKKADKNRED